jgi:hypothetical protein
MRKLLTVCACLLVAACAFAEGPAARSLVIALGNSTGGTNTTQAVSGYIEEVQVTCSDVLQTGSVFVAIVPADVTASAINIATNAVVGSKLWRPRVDATSLLGADLTSDPPVRYFVFGDTVQFIVTASTATNKTWSCRIKTSPY